MPSSSTPLLSNPWLIVILAPLLFLVIGGLGKMLVRGGWDYKDFCMGVEGTLATISSSLINIFDLVRRITGNETTKIQTDGSTQLAVIFSQMISSILIVIVSFFLFMAALALHRSMENSTITRPMYQRVLFCIGSNSMGLGSLAVFLIFVKGVS